MFTKRARRQRPAPDHATDGSLDRGGYPGLEGDFESERRRAASASHESVPAYEHDEGERPVLPASTAGLTHP